MNKDTIVDFFEQLSRYYPKSCQILVTGAVAAALYGRVRPTRDIDFEFRLKSASTGSAEADAEEFIRAANAVGRETGIDIQCAEDIDRWSSITLHGYREHSYFYQKFGQLEVRLMEPSYWAIGKLSRYVDPDIRDLIHVLQKTETPWQELARVAGTALRKSPKSTACFLFRKQTENFLNSYGSQIWGKDFDAKQAVQDFLKAAGIS